MAVTQPDLRQLESDPRRDSFPHDRDLGREGITLARQAEVRQLLIARQKLVGVPLYKRQVEHQMETVPSRQRG